MPIRILSAADVRAALPMPKAIDAMRHAYGQLSAGTAVAPPRQHIFTDKGVTLIMPAYLPERSEFGIKVVSVYDDNPNLNLPRITATVLVLDPATGSPKAFMDGASLTAIRTGAGGGLAADLLARKDAKIVGLFGAGVQARAQLQAVMAVREITRVNLISRTQTSAEQLAAEISKWTDVALRRGLRPRQVEHQAETLDLRPGGVGTLLEGLDRILRQTLANGRWQPGPVDGADHLAARDGGGEKITRSSERRGAGGGGRRAVDAAGQKRGGRLVGAGGRVMEKTHGPPLVNDGHPGRRRQVRKPPELALPGRGDQVGRVPRLAVRRGAAATGLGRPGRPAEGGEGLTVLLDRGRVDQQHRRVITAAQQLRAQVHVASPSSTPNVQTTEITRCENTTPDRVPSTARRPNGRRRISDPLAATPDPAERAPKRKQPAD